VSLEVVRVLVVLAVTELLHERSRGVAQVERDRVGARLLEVALKLADAPLERV